MINRILLILALAVPCLYVTELQAEPSAAIVERVQMMHERFDAQEAKTLDLFAKGYITASERDDFLTSIHNDRNNADNLLTL